MWNESLIELAMRDKRDRKVIPISVAILLHSVAILFFLTSTYWYVEGVQPHQAIKYWSEIPLKFTATPPLSEKAGTNSTQKPDKGVTKLISKDTVMQETITQQDFLNPADLNPKNNPLSNNAEDIGSGHDGNGVPGGDPFGNGSGNTVSGLEDSEEPAVIIVDGMQQPTLIEKTTPIYPPAALKLRLEGMVILAAIITKSGAVEEVRVMRSTNPIFEEPSVVAVKQWKYQPARFKGRPIKVYFTVTVKYSLK